MKKTLFGLFTGAVMLLAGTGMAAEVEVSGGLTITGVPGTDGISFPDGTTQTTAVNDSLSLYQKRVTGMCSAGYAISAIDSTGAIVTCQAVGSGTVTSIGTGAGLSGGPISTTGTISIPSGGVSDSMLATGISASKISGSISGNAASITGSISESQVMNLTTDLGNKAAKGANSDITSLSGLTTPLSVSQGGTGATTASAALTGLGAVSKAGDTMTGNLSLPSLSMTGNLTLPATTATSGIIKSGSNTIIHTFGSGNFFAGINAGNLSTTGINNTASGFNALLANTTGASNTASGYYALVSNTIGGANTASGSYTLKSNIGGANNTAIGWQALYSNTTGSQNTAIGMNAMFSNIIGHNNTAVGSGAGGSNMNLSGAYNTFLGYSSGATADGLTYATAIGAWAAVSQSNSIVLGGTGQYAVKVGIGTTAPNDTLDVVGTLRVNDNDIYLRGNNGDIGHGLGWYGNGFGKQFKTTGFAEGPVLYGLSSGALGTSNGGGNIALQWWDNGNVAISGSLSKGGGSFKIDHPLDPRNKYLYHSFVESPDMMNIYNGLITTDAQGYAKVELPEWFEALNRDFRYQLTVIEEMDTDEFVQAKIVRKIGGNSFTLRTSKPETEVSWQVTGIRKDAYAEKHRIVVEEEKTIDAKGTCLHPEACI